MWVISDDHPFPSCGDVLGPSCSLVMLTARSSANHIQTQDVLERMMAMDDQKFGHSVRKLVVETVLAIFGPSLLESAIAKNAGAHVGDFKHVQNM